MKLTEEQIITLSQWEEHFHCAVNADWCRNPGRSGLQVIHQIYTQATGDSRRLNDNCSHCILSLVRDCGKLYFKDKQELIDRKNDAKMVEISIAEAQSVRKSVKTRKNKKATE